MAAIGNSGSDVEAGAAAVVVARLAVVNTGAGEGSVVDGAHA